MRLLVVDNHDSFSFTLVDYLTTVGAAVEVVQSDAVSVAEALGWAADGIVLCPGPGRPEDAGISIALARACIDERRPLLGVCLGQQAIGLACGAELVRIAPVHGKAGLIRHDGTGLFEELPSPMTVTRYHSLAIAAVPEELRPTAWSEDGVVQAVAHREAPAFGVQFHPESVSSEHGHALLARFLQRVQLTRAPGVL
ncbi:aminodeoxychorismate/anthranilate synthase component II [Sphingomonas sp. BN140010]|uniref:Aminodeoxychorismate/anthranilate synthase component II n=1 Tax=Sphingomonas arvum TaxID=2992113 RepID=A0ABT3JI83_9SPHN|nr:aminodeoxychorismate/anthranilate synthase component II [Sphingomonas sp. BN140010]MCW3798785.1 aminodeoxychorismate/anthranilate synthase component II [Sphingomonas sp. BN140010]